MYKIGFLINSVGPSQQSVCLTQEMNALVGQEACFAPYLFYRNLDKIIIPPLFSLLSCYEAWSFDGIAIATDIYSAKILLKCPGPKKKFLYVWNMDWIFENSYKYKDMEDVYLNESLELISRSQYHSQILRQVWKSPITIIEEFNHDQIANFIKEQS